MPYVCTDMRELRIKRVEIRFRKSEYECLEEKAARKKITISEYLRLLSINDCKK